MARLIDADALKEKICNNVYPLTDFFNSRDYGMFWTGGIEKAIDEAPTIDAKPVIRCKDCAFYWYQKLKQDGTPDKRYNPSYCYYWGQGRNPNEYCSRAVSQVSLKNAIDEMIEEIKEKREENERKRKEEL